MRRITYQDMAIGGPSFCGNFLQNGSMNCGGGIQGRDDRPERTCEAAEQFAVALHRLSTGLSHRLIAYHLVAPGHQLHQLVGIARHSASQNNIIGGNVAGFRRYPRKVNLACRCGIDRLEVV